MTDMVKEAIADAKSLREGALENAKAILQEKFMPKIEEMIQESLIQEEDDEDLELDESTEADDDISLDENEDFDDDLTESEEDLELESLLRELEEDDDEDLDESTEDDEDLELESLLRELEEDDDDELEESIDEDDDEDLELESLLRELDEEEDLDEDDWEFDLNSDDKECSCQCKCDELETENRKLKTENKSLVRNNSSVKRDLKEAYDAIKLMKGKINEVNLMNSKLLYTQKIFNAYELNESQKMSILENFDNAASLKEVKLVYSTILAQYKQVTESKTVGNKLKGFASDTVIVEGKKSNTNTNSMVDRWQALAGVKKD